METSFSISGYVLNEEMVFFACVARALGEVKQIPRPSVKKWLTDK